MTKQEIFNRVCEHAMTQKGKCMNGISCSYREGYDASNPVRCFAGIFIPDERYAKTLEGGTCVSSDYTGYVDAGNIPIRTMFEQLVGEENIDFLRSMQLVHDQYEVEDWPCKLREIGEAQHLAIPDCIF